MILYFLLPALLLAGPVNRGNRLGNKARCLDSSKDSESYCYTDWNDVIEDVGILGKPIHEAVEISNAENAAPWKTTMDVKQPLALETWEAGIAENEQIANTPMGFLMRYNYIKGVLSATVFDYSAVTNETIQDALLTYSGFQGIIEAANAFEEMDKVRCRNPDINFDEDGHLTSASAKIIQKAIGSRRNLVGLEMQVQEKNAKRKKRFVHGDTGRGNIGVDKSTYTWALVNRSSGLGFPEDKTDFAFQQWNKAIGESVTFKMARSVEDADWRLSFVPDYHADAEFTMQNELAHAPYPLTPYHGEIHFRASKNWTDNLVSDKSSDAVNFNYVTLHEIGHLLGLEHSDDATSIMQTTLIPRNIPDNEEVELGTDDILGIQLLYGPGDENCDTDWKGLYGRCYKIFEVKGGVSHSDAAQLCSEHGESTLASVTSVTLMHFLKIVSNTKPFWIGYKGSSNKWANGESFLPEAIPSTNAALGTDFSNVDPTFCLVQTLRESQPFWALEECSGASKKVLNYICEKAERNGEATDLPTLPTIQTDATDEQPTSFQKTVPCQNYIRAAVRREDELYIFGTTHYFKYLSTAFNTKLIEGYPRLIAQNFSMIPSDFTAVVNDPYTRKAVYFVAGDESYKWRLDETDSSLENGFLSNQKRPRKTVKLFKTEMAPIVGAYKADSRSIHLFSKKGEVGRWWRQRDSSSSFPNRLLGRFKKLTKWNFFDSGKIDAVTDSYSKGYAMFFSGDEYWEMRKHDGFTTKNRKLDFPQLEICDEIVAPIEEKDEEFRH